MALVIDASIALKLALNEAGTVAARKLAAHADELIAPELMMIEAANALWANVRRGVITAENARVGLRLIGGAGIDIVSGQDLIQHAFDIANELAHPVYDCIYLALALDEDLPLVTADARFLMRVQGTPYAASVVDLETAATR